MMTCVYSAVRAASTSIAEQLRRAADAAQRVLDLVGEVADQLLVGLAWSSARSSRSWRVCCSISISSSSTRRARAVHLRDDHVHRQRIAAARLPQRRMRLHAAGRELVARHRGASRSVPASTNQSNSGPRCTRAATGRARSRTAPRWRIGSARRARPPPHGGSGRAWSNLGEGGVGGVRPPRGAGGDALPHEGGSSRGSRWRSRRCRFLGARDGGLHLGHAVQVLLVVALVAAALGLAVVVFLCSCASLSSSALQFVSRMRRASLSRALLVGRIDRGSAGRGARPHRRARRRGCGPWITVMARLRVLQPLAFRSALAEMSACCGRCPGSGRRWRPGRATAARGASARRGTVPGGMEAVHAEGRLPGPNAWSVPAVFRLCAHCRPASVHGGKRRAPEKGTGPPFSSPA